MHPRLISVPAVIARHARRVVTAAPPAIPGPASWCPGSNTSGHHPPRSDRSGALCMIAAPGRRSAGPEKGSLVAGRHAANCRTRMPQSRHHQRQRRHRPELTQVMKDRDEVDYRDDGAPY